MTPKAMDIEEILSILPHRHPMLFVDRVLEVCPGDRIVALKNFTVSEPFYRGHFPDRPVTPGIVLLEAMAQACALLAHATEPFDPKEKALYLLGFDRTRFRRVVAPGDQVLLEANIAAHQGDAWRFKAQALVGQKLAAESAILASISEKE